MATSEVLAVPAGAGVPHGRDAEGGRGDDHADPLALGFVPDPHRRYTAAEVRVLNTANPRHWPRFECARGRLLVTPAPAPLHQVVAGRLFAALDRYCDVHFAAGAPMFSPADISWGRRDTLLQPDVYVVDRRVMRESVAVGRERGSIAGWRVIRHLLLAIEVLSPSTAAADRGVKRETYQARGVPLYWVLDPEARQVEVWTPDATEPRVERERIVWHPDGVDAPFELPLAELFRPV